MFKRWTGCLLGCSSFLLVIVVGLMGFFHWFRYTSPVLEAGRLYTERVASYQGQAISSRKEVDERLKVFDEHFNSPMMDKMQGGEKTEVLVKDIETMFGEPDEIYTDEPIREVDTVYQYHMQGVTLNFHERNDEIKAFVAEEVSNELYDEKMLDQLFLYAVNQFAALHEDSMTANSVMVSVETMTKQLTRSTSTRIIHQNGWNSGFSPIYYYDDGLAEFSPEEYAAFIFRDTKDGEVYLTSIERRMRAGYEFNQIDGVYQEKLHQVNELKEKLVEEDEGTEQLNLSVADVIEELGTYSKIKLETSANSLSFYWYFPEGDRIKQVIAKGRVLGPISDFSEVLISRIDVNIVFEEHLQADEFISNP